MFVTAEDGARECVSECSEFYVYEEVTLRDKTDSYAHCYAAGCPESAPYFDDAAQTSVGPHSSCISDAQCAAHGLVCDERPEKVCLSPASCAQAGMLVYDRKCVSACPEDAFLDPTGSACVHTCPKYAEAETSSDARRCVCPEESAFDQAQNACVRTSPCNDYVHGVRCIYATECTKLGFFLQTLGGKKECVETCEIGHPDDSLRCVEACPRFFVEVDGETRCVSECPSELSFHEESGRCVATCAQKAEADGSCVKEPKRINLAIILAGAAGALLVVGITVGVVCHKRKKMAKS